MSFNLTFVLKENKKENLEKINLYVFFKMSRRYEYLSVKNFLVEIEYIKLKNI